MILQIKTQRTDPSVLVPEQAHETDAGYDLRSAVDVDIALGDRALVPTGVSVAIPKGYAGLILPRSGLALKHGVTVLNAPGLIDPGYRGEIQVALVHLGLRVTYYQAPDAHWHHNHVEPYFSVRKGDRIAQLVFIQYERAAFVNAIELDESDRGDNGFGSTGV